MLLSNNNECKNLGVKCIEYNIPYYISKHNFERTDFVKWLEECSVWVNDSEKASFDDIYQYWETVILQHQNIKYKSENDRLKMKHELLCILHGSIKLKDRLKEWLNYMLSELGIQTLLVNSEILPDEWENLESLLEEVAEDKYSDYDTNKFSKIGKPDNQITISTRHRSKGLEFEVVIMMGMEERHFPGWWVYNNPEALSESNRICFVCVSRAKRVCIMMCSNYYNEMDSRYNEIRCKRYFPSRYLLQLTINEQI